MKQTSNKNKGLVPTAAMNRRPSVRRRPVLAHDDATLPNARGLLVPPESEARLSSETVFWSAISEYGMACGSSREALVLKELFDEAGETATILSGRHGFGTYSNTKRHRGPPQPPTAEDMRLLAMEVAELDAMAMQASEEAARNRPTRRGRAHAAQPPPISLQSIEEEQQQQAALTIQSSSRRRRAMAVAQQQRQERPSRWNTTPPPRPQAPNKGSSAEPKRRNRNRTEAWALLERCERAAGIAEEAPLCVGGDTAWGSDGGGGGAEISGGGGGAEIVAPLRVGGDTAWEGDGGGGGAEIGGGGGGGEVSGGAEVFSAPSELRLLLGALCRQQRELLYELSARQVPVAIGAASAVRVQDYSAECQPSGPPAYPPSMTQPAEAARVRAAAAAEREEMASEILALVQVLRKGAQTLTQQRCAEASEAGAARASLEAQKKAEVLATEMEEDSLRAAAGGGGGGGGGAGGGNAAAFVKLLGAAQTLDLATAPEEDKASNLRNEARCAEALAGPDNAAAIAAAVELASLPRITPPPPPTTADEKPSRAAKPPAASVTRAAVRAVEVLEHLYELPKPPPPAAVLPLLAALGRMASLEPAAAAAAVEEGALGLLLRLITDAGDADASATSALTGSAVRLAACGALGEVVGSARHARDAAALNKALAAQGAPTLASVVAALLEHAGLAGEGGGDMPAAAAAAATATATATAPVAAIAAAALASVLRWRPDGVAFVPPSAITALVNRIAAPSADRGGRLADAGEGKDGGKDGGGAGSSSSSSSMLIGDVDLLGQLRVCGADIGRALRNTKSGLPRLVGMLDAPPPGAPTAAAKAALQLDRIIRAEAEAEGAVDAGSGAERGAAALTAAAAYGGMRASVIGSSVVGGTLEVATGGRSACAVACVRCPSRVALRALGGVARLAVLLAGPDGKPAAMMLQAGPPRTLVAVAGCLEVAVAGDHANQAEAARRGAVPSILRLISLAGAELKRIAQKGAGKLETEPELLPNLLLAASALVQGAPLLATQLREAGGIEVLLSLLELRPTGSVSEEHVLALEALHAVGEHRPERTARMLEFAPIQPKGAPSSSAEVAITVRAARAIGKLARPLIAEPEAEE